MNRKLILSIVFVIAAALFLAVSIRDGRPHQIPFAPSIKHARSAAFARPYPRPLRAIRGRCGSNAVIDLPAHSMFRFDLKAKDSKINANDTTSLHDIQVKW